MDKKALIRHYASLIKDTKNPDEVSQFLDQGRLMAELECALEDYRLEEYDGIGYKPIPLTLIKTYNNPGYIHLYYIAAEQVFALGSMAKYYPSVKKGVKLIGSSTVLLKIVEGHSQKVYLRDLLKKRGITI